MSCPRLVLFFKLKSGATFKRKNTPKSANWRKNNLQAWKLSALEAKLLPKNSLKSLTFNKKLYISPIFESNADRTNTTGVPNATHRPRVYNYCFSKILFYYFCIFLRCLLIDRHVAWVIIPYLHYWRSVLWFSSPWRST